VVGVEPENPGANLLEHADAAVDVACPHRAGQTERRVVGEANRFVLGVEGQNRQHRTEDLFAGDSGIRTHVGEDGRLDEVAVRQPGDVRA